MELYGDNTLIYGFETKLLLQIAPFSLLTGGPGSATTKVRFFEHLKFLFQPNKKLLFGKYHNRIWLRNTANTEWRFFHNISPLKAVKFRLKKIHLSSDIERSPGSCSTKIYTILQICNYNRRELLP